MEGGVEGAAYYICKVTKVSGLQTFRTDTGQILDKYWTNSIYRHIMIIGCSYMYMAVKPQMAIFTE